LAQWPPHSVFNRRERKGHGGFRSINRGALFASAISARSSERSERVVSYQPCKANHRMQNAVIDLANALRERLAIISDENSCLDPEKHMERLRAVSEKIDNLAAALPKPIDPQLAHFLQRKSYDKALEYLSGRAPSHP
jgi:hypothetical protein